MLQPQCVEEWSQTKVLLTCVFNLGKSYRQNMLKNEYIFWLLQHVRQKTFHIVYAEILLRVIQDHSYQQYITIFTSKFSSLVPYSILLDMTFLTTPIKFSCKVLFGSKIKMHASFSIFQTISNDCGPKCLIR